MNPLNLDGMSQFLGPGLGGLWAGEQQGLAVDAEKLRQQKTLDEMMTAAQTRDIAKQKLPFELDEMRARAGLNEASAGESRQRTAAGQVKLDREKFGNLMDTLSVTGFDPNNPLESATRVDQIIKQQGLDPEDPRIAMVRRATSDPAAWKKLVDAWALNQPDQRRKMQEKKVDLDREQMQQTGANQRQASQNATSVRVAEIQADSRVQAAQARGKQASDIFSALATGKVPPANAVVAIKILASKAESAEEKQYLDQIADMAEKLAQNLANPQAKSGFQVGPSGVTPTAPKPVGPAPIAPQANTAQGPPSSVPAPRLQGPAAEDWISRAMKANPGMTREQIIQQGQQLGKL